MCALRIILAERDPVTAAEVAAELSARGFEIAGIADNVMGLDALLNTTEFDLAVVAASLHGGHSFALVRSLRALGKPVGFVTSFGKEEIPEDLQSLPFLAKPVPPQDVADFVLSFVCAGRMRNAGRSGSL